MNKQELIDAISERADLRKVDAKNAVDAFMEITREELSKGGNITLVGFGTFNVTERAARIGRNPRTNEVLKIAAKKVVKFKPSSNLI